MSQSTSLRTSTPHPPELTTQPDLFGGLSIRVGLSRVTIPPELLPQFFTEVSFWAVTMLATEGTSWTPVTDQAATGGSSVTSANRSADPKAGK